MNESPQALKKRILATPLFPSQAAAWRHFMRRLNPPKAVRRSTRRRTQRRSK